MKSLELNSQNESTPHMTNTVIEKNSLFKRVSNERQSNKRTDKFNGFASNPLLDKEDNILLEDN